jgi:hypothetical protein
VIVKHHKYNIKNKKTLCISLLLARRRARFVSGEGGGNDEGDGEEEGGCRLGDDIGGDDREE